MKVPTNLKVSMSKKSYTCSSVLRSFVHSVPVISCVESPSTYSNTMMHMAAMTR